MAALLIFPRTVTTGPFTNCLCILSKRPEARGDTDEALTTVATGHTLGLLWSLPGGPKARKDKQANPSFVYHLKMPSIQSKPCGLGTDLLTHTAVSGQGSVEAAASQHRSTAENMREDPAALRGAG